MTVVHIPNSTILSSYARHFMTEQQEKEAKGARGFGSDGSSKTAKSTVASVEDSSSVKAGQDITIPQLEDYCDDFTADIKNKLATLTLSHETYSEALENREVYLKHPPVFSHKLEIDAPITNQKNSGRCWIFAGLNMLRQHMMKEYNLDELELSEPFVFFYDKLEKSNWFLENILRTLDEDLDGRLVQLLLAGPVQDGGQWDMFVALVEKYGVVPKEAYPETVHTADSEQMDWLITTKLREYAKEIRTEHANGKSIDELRMMKDRMLREIHKVISVSLGQPPKTIDWSFYSKDKKFHEFRNVTPLEFYKNHVKQDCTKFVSLINDPRNEYMKKYTVDYWGNVCGAGSVHFINLSVQRLKDYAIRVLESGHPVWFGCDIDKFFSHSHGMMDTEVIDYKSAFDFGFGMTKAERLQYGDSTITHAMVLTGVHIEDGKTIRWRIENSWGASVGNKGYLTMTDRWFDEFVYQIVIEKSELSKEVLDVLGQEAVVLPPWDLMLGVFGK
ncbi:bleomycin hydrolase [Coemansia sp. Benny D160-2]|nr:bleomycin hydrolase [Coemansia sp. Benny D160-2]